MDFASPENLNIFQLIHQFPGESNADGVSVYTLKNSAVPLIRLINVSTQIEYHQIIIIIPNHQSSIRSSSSYQTELSAKSHIWNIIVAQINIPDESEFLTSWLLLFNIVHLLIHLNFWLVFCSSKNQLVTAVTKISSKRNLKTKMIWLTHTILWSYFNISNKWKVKDVH